MRCFNFVLTAVVLAARIRAAPNVSAPDLGYTELYKLTEDFYNTFQYPNNVKEAQKINSTIFSEDVQGRVSDTRNFEGRELNTEYIFGLFAPSDSISVIGKPVGPYEILQFSANQNIAAATTRFNFTFESFGNISLPIVITTWMTFNAAKEITQYDVVFRWFGNVLQVLLSTVDPDPVKAQARGAGILAQSTCSTHQQYCTGANAQYESEEECVQFMTKDIRLGQSFELGMNTLLCRNVHEKMVRYRPEVHCPHLGKSGGGQCTDDISYMQKATETYYTNAAWIPEKMGPEPVINS